jgi:oligosaccharyltransferase complex subunit beta
MDILQKCIIFGLFTTLVPVRAEDNVLVIVDSPSRVDTHSLFIKKLKSSGFNTEVKHVDDPTLVLKKYGEFLYEHIVLLAPSTEEFTGTTSTESLVEFIDAGGNIIVTADVETGDAIRDLASEVGVEIDESGNSVIDHFNFDEKDEGYHTKIRTSPDNLISSEHIVKKTRDECLYHGTGLATDSSNPLVLNILTASSTAYSHNPQEAIKDYPHAVGKNTILIAGLQARNNARVLVLGSIDFLSDEFLIARIAKPGQGGKSSPAGNNQVVADLLAWCFKQSGVIRIDFVEHKSVETGSKFPPFYTVREECEYSVKISELVNGVWVPFHAKDVQMEFVRIDPFVRLTMSADKSGVFKAKFIVPDVYGVFKFVVRYSRLGLTTISSSNQISVHPLRHNQYERFIYSAYPYYASAFSMMAGVFVFAFVFLHHKDPEAKPKSE